VTFLYSTGCRGSKTDAVIYMMALFAYQLADLMLAKPCILVASQLAALLLAKTIRILVAYQFAAMLLAKPTYLVASLRKLVANQLAALMLA
jgi:hypothetical protein